MTDPHTQDTTGPRTPVRRPLKDLLAAADGTDHTNPGRDGENLLTTTTTIASIDAYGATFGVDHTGAMQRVDHTHAPTQGYDTAGTPGTPVPDAVAATHHLLLVSDEVEADELEALALSEWDEAGWVRPGRLRMRDGVVLHGPWTVSPRLREERRIPADLTRAWVLDCRKVRGAAPDSDLVARDPLAAAFPDGMPAGVELDAVTHCLRMARRLGGALTCEGGAGPLLHPDPDSAVNLRVLAPRWMGPEALAGALADVAPGIVDARDVPVEGEAAAGRRSRPSVKEQRLRDGLEPLSDEVRARLEADRAEAQRAEQLVDGYALVADAGRRSRVVVEVMRMGAVPRAVRWEPWAASGAVEYRVVWLPAGGLGDDAASRSRVARVERAACAALIERLAARLVSLVGGAVLDEDGFLVAFDEET